MMATDYSKANSELQAIASKNGVTLPSKLDAAHQEKVDKISNLSGEQFDKTYVSEMVKDHEKVAGEFEKASKTAQIRIEEVRRHASRSSRTTSSISKPSRWKTT